jgi:peptide subunit release factor 1 (eRF1)
VCIVPGNGLVIYCGTIATDDGKEKKVNIDFEPFRAINTSLYLCDNKFHTEASHPFACLSSCLSACLPLIDDVLIFI